MDKKNKFYITIPLFYKFNRLKYVDISVLYTLQKIGLQDFIISINSDFNHCAIIHNSLPLRP